jgi:hypothetical protein
LGLVEAGSPAGQGDFVGTDACPLGLVPKRNHRTGWSGRQVEELSSINKLRCGIGFICDIVKALSESAFIKLGISKWCWG